MKATIEIVLDGNMKIPTAAKCDTLADVAKLGAKLIATARNAPRLIPALKDLPVKAVKITTE